MLEATKVKRDLPRLEEYKKNIIEWIENFKDIYFSMT